jgi:hypothetical protein
MRKYKKIDAQKSEAVDDDLKQVEALFWAIIQLDDIEK